MSYENKISCPVCNGLGRTRLPGIYPSKPCERCYGTGYVKIEIKQKDK